MVRIELSTKKAQELAIILDYAKELTPFPVPLFDYDVEALQETVERARLADLAEQRAAKREARR